MNWPKLIENEEQLNDILSTPYPALVEMMRRIQGDIIILGIAGKMGVSLAHTAVRAIQDAGVSKRVIGVARFSDASAKKQIEDIGVETIVCDLMDRKAIAELPRVENVIFMAGRKFGTQGNLDLTWAMNVLMPGYVAEHFTKSRIVAFSTGCVYPLVSEDTAGCTEDVPPDPIGEYSQSCLGRERAFGHFSRVNGTPVCLFRLNYSNDLRYGVLFDIATKVYSGQPVDVSMSVFNVIWQGDAVNHALLALEHCASPAMPLNCTGPEILHTRKIAEEFGKLMNKEVTFAGIENPAAYLNNADKALKLFGPPQIPLVAMMRWVAHWIEIGGRSLDKPTHFEVTDGKY